MVFSTETQSDKGPATDDVLSIEEDRMNCSIHVKYSGEKQEVWQQSDKITGAVKPARKDLYHVPCEHVKAALRTCCVSFLCQAENSNTWEHLCYMWLGCVEFLGREEIIKI